MKSAWIVFILLPFVSGFKTKKHQLTNEKTQHVFDRAVLSKVPLSTSLLDKVNALEKDFDAQNIGNFKENPWRLVKPFGQSRGQKKLSSNKDDHKKGSRSLNKKKVDRKEKKLRTKEGNRFELRKHNKAEERKERKENRNVVRVSSPRQVGKSWKHSKESLRKSDKHGKKSKKLSTKKWQKKRTSKMSPKQKLKEDDLVKVSRTRKQHHKTQSDKNKLKGCYRKEACFLRQRPLCGSDGKTYGNKCMLRMAACMKGDRHAILPAHKGRCKE